MAGDWVKMRSALLANPKVHAIAKAIGRDSRAGEALAVGFTGCPSEVLSRHALRHVTVTALLCVWSAANEHSDGGKLSCCDLEDLDEIAGVPGFGEAMQGVGWARRDDAENCVFLPNFSEHNTTAKDRTAAERQRRHRQKRNGVTVTRDSTVTVTQRREEKRREEDKHTHPAREADDEFRKPGWAATEWDAFLPLWNACKRAARWDGLGTPSGWVDAAASPGWLQNARKAVDRLGRCQFFENPLAITQFLEPGWVDRINAGEFDNAKRGKSKPERGGDFGGAPPPPKVWTGPQEAARIAMLERSRKLKEEVSQ